MDHVEVTLELSNPKVRGEQLVALALVKPQGDGIGHVTIFTGTAEIRIPFLRANDLDKIVRALRSC